MQTDDDPRSMAGHDPGQRISAWKCRLFGHGVYYVFSISIGTCVWERVRSCFVVSIDRRRIVGHCVLYECSQFARATVKFPAELRCQIGEEVYVCGPTVTHRDGHASATIATTATATAAVDLCESGAHYVRAVFVF